MDTNVPPTHQRTRADNLESAGTLEITRLLIERLELLAKKELELARSESKGDVRHGRAAGIFGAVGMLTSYSALACGLIAGVNALGQVMRAWVAALLGCIFFVLLTAVFATLAWREVQRARPRRTLREARAALGLFRWGAAGGLAAREA